MSMAWHFIQGATDAHDAHIPLLRAVNGFLSGAQAQKTADGGWETYPSTGMGWHLIRGVGIEAGGAPGAALVQEVLAHLRLVLAALEGGLGALCSRPDLGCGCRCCIRALGSSHLCCRYL